MSAERQHQSSAPAVHGPRWRTAFTALRDIAMTALALWGVWHQEHTGHVLPWLLGTYVVILGLIPASHALALARMPSPPEAAAAASAPDTAPTLR